MKRFVVIVTSLLIIFVFIALNYLLWDRESLVTTREHNQASIDALGRINMVLNEDKNRLEKQIEELNNQIRAGNEKTEELEDKIQSLQSELNDKLQFISVLKTQIDPTPVQNSTIEWIYAIADRNYTVAFLKSESNCRFWDEAWSLKTFSDFFDGNIALIEPVLDGEEQIQPEIEVIPSDTPDWEMQVLVRVNVELSEDANQQYLNQGQNVLQFLYTYSARIDQWVITSISTVETEPDDTETSEGDETMAEGALPSTDQ
jgi:cell division protein FtsB